MIVVVYKGKFAYSLRTSIVMRLVAQAENGRILRVAHQRFVLPVFEVMLPSPAGTAEVSEAR